MELRFYLNVLQLDQRQNLLAVRQHKDRKSHRCLSDLTQASKHWAPTMLLLRAQLHLTTDFCRATGAWTAGARTDPPHGHVGLSSQAPLQVHAPKGQFVEGSPSGWQQCQAE